MSLDSVRGGGGFASPESFRLFFETMTEDALALLDRDGRVIGWNRAIARLTGCPAWRASGRHVSWFWPEWETIGVNPKAPWGFPASWRFDDDRTFPLRVTVKPLQDDDERPAGFALFARIAEIDEVIHPSKTIFKQEGRRRAESDRLARSVLDSFPSQIAVLDERGLILQVNQAWMDFAEANGASGSVSVGVNYLEVCESVEGDDRRFAEAFAGGIRDVLAGRREGFAIEYPCSTPTLERWFRGRIDPFQGEGPPRVVVSHQDVTEPKANEEALKHYARRLEILRAIDRVILEARSPEEIARTTLDHLETLAPGWWGVVESFERETGGVRVLADRREGRDEEGGRPSGHWMRIPLVHAGTRVGSLEIGSRSPPIAMEDELELVREVAVLLAIAIRQALLYEEIAAGKERLEIVSRRLIHAEEDERRRIARELHDEIGQALTALKIHLRTVLGHGIDDSTRAHASLEEAIPLVDRVLRQIRSISLDLRPSLLDDFGLVAALRSLLNNQARLGGFATQLRVVADDPEFRLGPELETTCFRVAQESLTNIVRHAQARYVDVEVRRGERSLELLVTDDGVGFDPEAELKRASSGESFGLLGMKERAALLGGQIDFASEPGRGTRIVARFPVPPDP